MYGVMVYVALSSCLKLDKVFWIVVVNYIKRDNTRKQNALKHISANVKILAIIHLTVNFCFCLWY